MELHAYVTCTIRNLPVNTCTYMYMYMYMCTQVHMHVHLHIHLHVHVYVGSQMPFPTTHLARMVQQLRDLFVSLHFEKQLPHLHQKAGRDLKPTTQVCIDITGPMSVVTGREAVIVP